MKICDISPFLRNVVPINFIPMQEYGIAGDCHFFFMEDGCTAHIDGVSYNIAKDCAVLVPAGVMYYFECKAPIRMIAVNFDYTQSASEILSPKPPRRPELFREEQITERPDFEDYSILNRPMVLENMWSLRQQIESVLNEFECKRQFYREIAEAKFKNVIFEIMRAAIQGSKSSATVDLMIEYIHSHYSEDIDNDSVANSVGYHSYYLNRLMKSVTGTTIRQYIINYRIEMAKRYMQQSELSICAVAELCGYKNLSNFSVDFKKKTGVSPSRYRANINRMI